jgi:hypothetical protein
VNSDIKLVSIKFEDLIFFSTFHSAYFFVDVNKTLLKKKCNIRNVYGSCLRLFEVTPQPKWSKYKFTAEYFTGNKERGTHALETD